MNRRSNRLQIRPGVLATLSVAALVSMETPVPAQSIPAGALAQFEKTVGNRIEGVTILGGDYGASGGAYAFRGGSMADLSVTKIGGSGDITTPFDLGKGISWAPVLLGNIGYISAENQFKDGLLKGNKMLDNIFGLEFGVGAHFYLGDHLSLTPTIAGMYGHTENEFNPQNSVGQTIKTLASGTFVDWRVDTWSVIPGLELEYTWTWGRTIFDFSSRFSYFHTESFNSTSRFISIDGNSQSWVNKIDVDVPLGWKVLGRELHTGGFISRTELFGDAADGFKSDHLYTFNGRLVLDFLGKLWKVRWLGLGGSYIMGEDFDGWSVGADVRFKF